jgi:hypothetical protein
MADLIEHRVSCPYCGETITLFLDGSVADWSSYTEDCQVCCQPMVVQASMAEDGSLEYLRVLREDESG